MKPLELVLSLLTAVLLGLAGFQLKWTFDTNAELMLLKERLDVVIHNTETDTKQNITLIHHWKLHSWARDEINRLRFKQGLEPVGWPALDHE